MLDSTRYKVFFTPLIRKNVYGSAVEVTDLVSVDGIDTILTSIDSTDYDVGIFTFGDIQLKCNNQDGIFNTETDYRSMFKFQRDLCKVDVHFQDAGVDQIVFHGIIADEATEIDAQTFTIDFRVLSRDAALKNTNVSAGIVTNSMTTTDAFRAILNVPDITSVLTFDPTTITPFGVHAISNGASFDNKPVKDAIEELLLATNSVLIIDATGKIIVRDRDPDVTTAPINLLFGPYDIQRRENIVSLTEFNTGKQRMFTAVNVNGQEAQNFSHIQTFGYRKKEITLDWITDDVVSLQIAQDLLDEFSSPKMEFKVQVASHIAKDIQMLDIFSVNWPLRIRPYPGSFLPIVGITKIGDTDQVLPYVFGSFSIDHNVGFKVLEKVEDPASFLTTLKLRQIGKTLSDGNINVPNSSLVGFAVVGLSMIASGTDDTWNPAYVGGARIGDTAIG